MDAVTGVTHDSREAGPGVAFVAVPGFKRDGTMFAAEAVRRGSPFAVAEREVSSVPTAVVPNAREALAALAAAVYGNPSERMEVYGVTGTNGKTTTSYALHAILAAAHGEAACGLMTTAGTVSGGERPSTPPVRTTPEAPEVQRLLAGMRERGVRRVVLEVSSHGIALKRVAGTRFAGALFTNLTRDHLDLHGSMEEYYRTKRELFRWVASGGPKLVNAEDAHGRRIAAEIEGVKTFGGTPDADYRVTSVRAERGGTAFSLSHDGRSLELRTSLLGPYNVLNAAGAAAFALELGTDSEMVGRAVSGMPQVPGRFERVLAAGEFGFEVIVDYAHTDVGLEAVLKVARGVAEANGSTGGRVVCVFGAAGERDGDKRPKMGRVASELADRSIVTTDDAYSEDPMKIAREVAAGVATETGRSEIILDRREAIRRALGRARAGDVVVVAGKGHETVQHLPEGDVPFHDASVVRELLRELRRK
ncbi:MAG: UDP-N-acetylmuramoyl-L-alanyl-D-glutamate--2,6-diaminopimelate ligase [Rubrobacteraceae bacterium]